MNIKTIYERHCQRYLRSYEKIYEWFDADFRRKRALKIISDTLTAIIFSAYAGLIIPLAAAGAYLPAAVIVIVSSAAFAAATVIRRKINALRPYERSGVKALVPKSTKGKSCPSRHSACAFIIAMAWIYLNLPIGFIIFIIAAIIAALRPIMGVHYPLDVIFGALLSVVIGAVGFSAAYLLDIFPLTERYVGILRESLNTPNPSDVVQICAEFAFKKTQEYLMYFKFFRM